MTSLVIHSQMEEERGVTVIANIYVDNISLFPPITTRQKIINLFRVDENRIKQCFAAHIVRYCSALLHQIQAQQYCSILLTTVNNVGSTTFFSLVFINPEQVDNFLPCRKYLNPLIDSGSRVAMWWTTIIWLPLHGFIYA